MIIRFKTTLPILLITLIIVIIGIYGVTKRNSYSNRKVTSVAATNILSTLTSTATKTSLYSPSSVTQESKTDTVFPDITQTLTPVITSTSTLGQPAPPTITPRRILKTPITPTPASTATPSVTATPIGTVTSTITPTATETSTAIATATPTATPIIINFNWGPPDGFFINPADGTILTYTLSPAITDHGDSGYDFVYYERATGPTSIQMGQVIIEVSPDGSTWYTVFYWGDNAPDANSNLDFSIRGFSGEADNQDVSGGLINGTGIGIDIYSLGLVGNYSYLRITAPNNGGGDGIEIDSIEIYP
jgi:hypothetical protein